MFLAVTTPLPTGTEMRIRFRPAKHLPAIQAKAKVVYQIAGRGTGIEFTEIDPQDRQVLLRIIHRRTADRGREARVPLATQIYSDEGMWLAFSRDVSVGGMFVETKQSLSVGSHLTLRFHLDPEGPIVVATAEVRYVLAKFGMGVQFIESSPADRERISAYVSRFRALADSTEGAAAA